MKKTLLIAGAVIIGLIAIVVFGLTFLVDANQFRPQLEARMGDALGRKVSLGTVRIAIFSAGISVQNLSIADDPAFSTAPFVTAKAVRVGVDLIPLLLERSLRVESFRLEEPQLLLLHSASGQWNFSGLGSSANTRSGTPAAAMSVLIQKITIARGRVVVGTPASRAKDRVYEDVTLEATDLSYASPFPFRLSARTPGNGTMNLKGQAGPIGMNDVAETPFQAAIDIKHLDIASTGFLDAAAGLGGIIDFSGTLASDGQRIHSRGNVKATKVQLVSGGSPARVPVAIDYESDYGLKTRSGVVKQGDVHIGNSLTHLTGDYNTAGESIAVRMRLTGQKVPVSEIEAALPAIAVTLPPEASFQGGTVDTNLVISGPIDRLVTTGPIALSNAHLRGFDLGGRMRAIAAFAGLPQSGETVIEMLSSTLHIAPEGVRADSLNLLVPSVGTLTGNGTVAAKGAMDFRMLAKLKGGNQILDEISRLTSLGHPENGIPFRIVGTTSNPVFVPDVAGAVSTVINNPDSRSQATGFLRGLFRKKK